MMLFKLSLFIRWKRSLMVLKWVSFKILFYFYFFQLIFTHYVVLIRIKKVKQSIIFDWVAHYRCLHYRASSRLACNCTFRINHSDHSWLIYYLPYDESVMRSLKSTSAWRRGGSKRSRRTYSRYTTFVYNAPAPTAAALCGINLRSHYFDILQCQY